MRWGSRPQSSNTLLSVYLSVCFLLLILVASPAAAITKLEQALLRDRTKALFYHGFDNYIDNAWPKDELKPLSCTGQGPEKDGSGAVNDVAGDYMLTLIDVIDTLVVMGNHSAFHQAVKVISQQVNFNKDHKVQVFEVTIRVMGGLLSGHQFAEDPKYGFALPDYNGELLSLAYNLGLRLLPAFQTASGLPYARVNLIKGVERGETYETCTAGAGSLLLEFATLSRLSGDKRFETAASKAFFALWNFRSSLSLLGNAINVQRGAWIQPIVSHIGAGTDSFFEYALKSYVLLGEEEYYDVFQESYAAVMSHVRGEEGFWFRGVNMGTGERVGTTVDSLAAFFSGTQVLAGDLDGAIKSHLAYWNLWRRYGGIPESFNIIDKRADQLGYPLRPEFVESTYFLYQATKDDLYLDIGKRILNDIETKAKVPCGLASFKNLLSEELEDRMETFALSETLKYLYLLFDEEHWVNKEDSNMVFTTEGHLLQIPSRLLKAPSSTRRKLRAGERPQCPVYNPLLKPIKQSQKPFDEENDEDYSYFEPQYGIMEGIRNRPDYDFARALSGLKISKVVPYDSKYWSPSGFCVVPKEESYVLDVVFSNDPAAHLMPEDKSPGKDKLLQTIHGFVLKQTDGIRAKVTKRLDKAGYDVTSLGAYNVRSGQKVLITDANLNKMFDDAKTVKQLKNAMSATRTLRFTMYHGDTSKILFQGTASTAFFGAVTSEDGSNATPPSPLYVGSPEVQLVLPSEGNPMGCDPYTEPIPALSKSSSAFVLVERGGCTFYKKLSLARAAGAKGAIVWSPKSDNLQPAMSPEDEEEDGAPTAEELKEVALLYLSGQGGEIAYGALSDAIEGGGASVLTAKIISESEGGENSQLSHSKKKGPNIDSSRLLWIAGQPVLNTYVIKPWE